MHAAITFYPSIGVVEIDACTQNPNHGAAFMQLALRKHPN